MKKKILLTVPPWRQKTYEHAKVRVAAPNHPMMALATVAAPLVNRGCDVRILDLDLHDDMEKALREMLQEFNPDYVGITGTTPYYNLIVKVADIAKDVDKNIVTVVGGVHASIFPEEMARQESVDISVYGEGDFTIPEIIDSKDLSEVKGICYKENGKIVKNLPRPLLQNLDELPFPAWNLFDISRYNVSHLVAKKSPVGAIETSRGCVYGCTYCNKLIQGRTFRVKSAKRTVDEMEYMVKCGFKEIHVIDDGFSTDLQRAKDICSEIIGRGLKVPWNLFNGIRVDRVDLELLEKLKNAGCYQISIGVESGNQNVLDTVNKGIKLEDIRRAVKLAKKAGIDIQGYFMLGLPADTRESMQDTINFAKELNLDKVKFAITTPFPGTMLYYEYEKKGLIKLRDWSYYLLHEQEKIYQHPNLNVDEIKKFYEKAYREYYLRWGFVKTRFIKSMANGTLLKDAKAFLQTKW
ncbi:cobalamin-dependent protein [Candidatus Woesearchaeota archaeon]|nr:cobalamin-dependent protein [Candidatus Woesearchaeota archaeon]